MIVVNLRRRKILSALAILLTAFLLIGSGPATAASKTRKASARTAKKPTKKKPTRKQVAKKSASKKSTSRASSRRSTKKKTTVAKRGKRGRTVARSSRGRRSKWKTRVARTTPSYGHGGVHTYLTDAWSNAHSGPAVQRSSTPSMTASGDGIVTTGATTAAVPAGATQDSNGNDIPPQQSGQPPNLMASDSPELNPLVLAYTSSLSSRGHNPDNQGFIVSTMDGQILAEHNADRPFNPASVVKMATSLVAISRLGPDFRFRTTMYTNGTLDPSTGILNGSLYVIGSGDPAFFYENALLIADKLNRSGIREVNGDLVVLGPFHFNFSAAREMSAKGFRTTMTPETWTAAAKTAFPRFISMRAAEDRAAGRPFSTSPPSLKITGKTLTNEVVNTSSLRILAVHTSLPLVRLLKGLNDFSNNWMASVIGSMVGGPDAVETFLLKEVGLKDEELGIVTASGLGSNYISPRATLQVLRKLVAYLDKERLGLEELLPVAGVDAGTLGRRFTDEYRGAVVAKTGTLSGVSALAGIAYTRTRGPLLFVMYNRGGSSYSFRSVQDETLRKVITFFGGPAPVKYLPTGGPAISGQLSEGAARSSNSTSPPR